MAMVFNSRLGLLRARVYTHISVLNMAFLLFCFESTSFRNEMIFECHFSLFLKMPDVFDEAHDF